MISATELDKFMEIVASRPAHDGLGMRELGIWGVQCGKGPNARGAAAYLAEISGAVSADALWSAWCHVRS